MSKLRLLAENFLIYGVGGVISKMVPLIMTPIIVRLMPDSACYGVNDLSNTIVSFASAIAVFGMYDAMFRYFFEDESEDYRKRVCSTALTFTLVISLFVFIVMMILREPIAGFFLGDKGLADLVAISAAATLVGATNSIVSAPTRMQNKRKIFLCTNLAAPVISYSIAVLMLINGHFMMALPMAALISAVMMEFIFFGLNYRWFDLTRFDFVLLKRMLVIAVPLIPSFLVYWIFNSSDRLMISNIMTVSDVGIYSIGSKLGQASQLIYTAFAGGWQYFTFATMKEEDQVKSNSMILEYMGALSFVAAAFICAWSYGIYKLLFVGSYVSGFIIAPYLFLAPLLLMLYQIAASQFVINMKTWPNMLILFGGAAMNVMLNLVLIPAMGIEGAAVATLLGYVAVNGICIFVMLRLGLVMLSKRFIVVAMGMLLYFALWRLLFVTNTMAGTMMAVLYAAACAAAYRKDCAALAARIKFKGRKR